MPKPKDIYLPTQGRPSGLESMPPIVRDDEDAILYMALQRLAADPRAVPGKFKDVRAAEDAMDVAEPDNDADDRRRKR